MHRASFHLGHMRRLALVAPLALVVACGARTSFGEFSDAAVSDTSSDDGSPFGDTAVGDDTAPSFDSAFPPFDSGAFDSATPPFDSGTFDSVTPPFDSGTFDTGTFDTAVDVGPEVGPTGTPCTTDLQCQRPGINAVCSSRLFPNGPYSPNPFCVSRGCDFGDGQTPMPCDGDKGLCLQGNANEGICFPKCTFNDTGAPPVGCLGNDACNIFDVTTSTTGVGYCFGGCQSDAQCPNGSRCQKEFGYCLYRPFPTSKKLGDACTQMDANRGTCNCLLGGGNQGYCSQVCRIGDPNGCPTGFTCDAFIPSPFTVAPKGMGGYCLKTCTSAADCPTGTSSCQQSGGISQQTCMP